jgi:hypothetical protein
MIWTRRRFLVTAALVPAIAAVESEASATPTIEPLGFPHDDPAFLVGDPYLASVSDSGFGGRCFAEAREHAFRFRTPPAERDRHLLGVEPDRA